MPNPVSRELDAAPTPLHWIRQVISSTLSQAPKPRRRLLGLDIERTMRTRYKIDSYQQTYFVINSFQELFDKAAPDFTAIYERLRALPEIAADARAAGEEVIQQ